MFFIDVLLKLLLILAFVVPQGLCALQLVRYRCRSRIDLVLVVSAVGIAVSGLAVYLLLIAGLYYRFSTFIILFGPFAWLLYRYRLTNRILPKLLSSPTESAPVQVADFQGRKSSMHDGPGSLSLARMTAIDRLAIFISALLLLVLFCNAFTSPILSWDGVITWDKWAADWAARSNLYGYAQGGYPQLLPMFSSLLYKITGHYSAAVSSEQYALHAFQPLLGFLLLLGCIRAAQLFRLPVWAVIALVFGFKEIQPIITWAGADLLVTVLVLITVISGIGRLQQQWEARLSGVPLFMLLLFAAAFTKAGGFLAMLFILLLSLPYPATRFPSPLLPFRLLAPTLLVPIILLGPFYAAQFAASQEPVEKHNPQETDFLATGMVGILKNTADSAYVGKSLPERIHMVGNTILANYAVPEQVQLSAELLLVVMALMSVRFRPVLMMAITGVTWLFVWLLYASYDLRNLLPAIPILGICITTGGLYLYSKLERYRWAQLLQIGVVGFLALGLGGRISADTLAVIDTSFSKGRLASRVQAADAGILERIKLFFPTDYGLWVFLSGLHLLSKAHHVVAASPIYRWVPGGIYPLSWWNSNVLEPGDLYISPPPYSPSGNSWTMLRDTGLRVWIRDRLPVNVALTAVVLTGATAPKLLALTTDSLDAEAGGNQSLMVYNFPDRDIRTGGTLVWEVSVETAHADPSVKACSLVYDPTILDSSLSTASTDASDESRRVVKYSGTLAIRPGNPSLKMVDGILIGICRSGQPAAVRIRSFKYSLYRW